MQAERLSKGTARSTIVADPGGALRAPYGSAPEGVVSTSVTAQIPAVPAGPKYGVLLPDGSIWYPGSRKKLPAPLALRVVVWALAFLVLLAAAADVIVHTRPTWVDPLRRHVPVAGATLPNLTTSGSTRPASHGRSPARLAEVSPPPAGTPRQTTIYRVSGVSSYSVSVSATQLTYLETAPLRNGVVGAPPIFAGDLQAGETKTFSVSGPVAVQVAAGGSTVKVLSGGKQIGTVAPPPYVPWNFWFEPAGR